MEAINIFEWSSKIIRRSPQLFDPVRKTWVLETPEESVRQSMIQWLHDSLGIPFSRMTVEKQILVLNARRRFDLVIYDRLANPFILIECKAPSIAINQRFFDQAAAYNLNLKAPYLAISNGPFSLFAKLDFATRQIEFIPVLPSYPF